MASTAERSESLTRAAAFFRELRGAGPGAVLARGASTALVIRAAGMGIAFLVQIALARLLGVTEYGIYVYALSWIMLAAMPASLGFELSSLRFVAQYRRREQWGLLRGFLAQRMRMILLWSIFLAILGGAIVYLVRPILAPGLTVVFWLACCLIPVLVQIQIGSSALKAFQLIARSQLPVDIVRPLLMVVLVAAFQFTTSGSPTAIVAMSATIIASMITLGMIEASLRTVVKAQIPQLASKTEFPSWLAVSIPLFVLSGLFLLLSQTDILMIGALLDTTQAGIYSVASRIAGLMLIGVVVVNTVAAPMIAGYYAGNEKSRLARILRVAAWAKLGLAISIGVMLVLFGSWLLGLFSQEFRIAFPALLILTAGHLISGFTGVASAVMTMTGSHLPAMRIAASAALLNAVLNWGMIPVLGIVGAAIATAVSTSLWNLVLLWFVIRRYGFNPTPFGRAGA